MRKITILMVLVSVLWTMKSFATNVQTYFFKDDLSSEPAANWGFGSQMGTTTWAYNTADKSYQFRWTASTSGATYSTNRTLTTAIIPSAVDNKITVQTIIKFYTSGRGSNPGSLFFADSLGNVISGITFWTTAKSSSSSAYQIARATSFNSTDINTAPATTTTFPTVTDWNAVTSSGTAPVTARITLVFDFSAHTLDYTIENGTFNTSTRAFTTSTTVASTAQTFINTSALNFKTFYMNYIRNAGGTATPIGFDMYYMGISTVQSVSTANVTVNYYDADSPTTLIKSETRADQAVNATYSATSSDKATYTANSYYYTYSSMALDNQVVASDGSAHVDILMKKYPIYSGNYTWTGTTDGNWNELKANFTDGTNVLGYQPGNGVIFPSSGTTKTVILNDNISLGTGDITISGDKYVLEGSGSLAGSGKLNIALSATDTTTLNLTNNLTGSTQIAGGNIVVKKAGVLGVTPVINGATSIISNYTGLAIPATTFNASSKIVGGTNSNTSLTGMTLPSGVKLTASSAYNHANSSAYAFSFAASGSVAAGSEIELNGAGTDNRMGMSSASADFLKEAKINLTGNVLFYIQANQSAATTINIGTLNGEATARLGWGGSSALDRDITWSVGALNENSTYAGTITNLGGYAASGASYTGNNTNFTKVGTGILTFAGTATTHNGAFTVNGGELQITGKAGNIVSKTNYFTVNGATLSAMSGGKISASKIIMDATAQLKIGAGSTDSLKYVGGSAITNLEIQVNGTSAGQLVIVPDSALTIGALNITAIGTAVPNTQFQLIKATDPTKVIYTSAPVVPTGYTFDTSTGILTCTVTAVNSQIAFSNRIYAADNKIHFESKAGKTVEIFNALGMKVISTTSVEGVNTIPVTAKGLLIVKVGNLVTKITL